MCPAGLVSQCGSKLGQSVRRSQVAVDSLLQSVTVLVVVVVAPLGAFVDGECIGGINSISNDLYEAATIDGASGVQAFFRITVPMLAPTTFMVVLLSTVNLLKEYALVQGITQGGPGLSTTFIIQYIFDKGFNQMQYGYASAISTVVMIIFALIAFAQFKVNNGGET